MSSYIENAREFWDDQAGDAAWAVLSDPEKRDGKWDAEEFYSAGRSEISTLFDFLEPTLGSRIGPFERALDFGCGIGRLTQALGSHAKQSVGVDISVEMVKQAREMNSHENVVFHDNAVDDLGLFDSETFDFIYSSITLQHINPEASVNYLREFARISKPGGLIVFQLPSQTHQSRFGRAKQLMKNRLLVNRLLCKLLKLDGHELHAVSEKKVVRLFESLDCALHDVSYTNSTLPDFNGKLEILSEKPDYHYVSRQYVFQKNPG
ncbi:MAG: class I SAM-dependent methyltransferase [Verrucomicrobiales bacterium]|nr:class I SAM-dependent methyltransferase [Verrucomicrobiales bacterium]